MPMHLSYRLTVMMIVLSFVSHAWAEVRLAHPELADIVRRIEARQKHENSTPRLFKKIVLTPDSVMFMEGKNAQAGNIINTNARGIERYVRLTSTNDAYAFVISLRHDGQPYAYEVAQINGGDALLCFGENDVFIYAQEKGEGETTNFREWIYVKRPNFSGGSQWEWTLQSEPWQWPLSIALQRDGHVNINRHMPFSGIPIKKEAKDQFLLEIMVKFKHNEPIKKYFPFEEPIASMAPARIITREGLERFADVNVKNISAKGLPQPPPKHGFDMRRWRDHWQSQYTVTVRAQPEEYPLLIE